MILRNGILSTLRAGWRTALFSVLILFMCLSLTLGAGMWAYCDGQLKQLDSAYTSIALVEYMGAGYPEENAADPYARAALAALDLEQLHRIPGVKLWESQDSTLAYVEGYKRLEASAYSDHAVIEFIQFADVWNGNELYYAAISNRVFYARDIHRATAMVVDKNGFDFTPEPGRRYTIHGRFIPSNSTYLRFAITDFYEGCDTLPWQDTKEAEPAPIFLEYAEHYEQATNYVTVNASADIASLEVFQQDVFRLTQGRFPAKGEKGTCLISGDMALQMKLQPGDRITLEHFTSDPDDRLRVEKSGQVRSLEVVGITTMPEGMNGYVWVSDAEGSFGGELYGYTLGRALLDNASAREATTAIEALCGRGVRVTLFDQGYSGAAQPLETMGATATAVTIASALGALTVIVLFAYLFVGRQRETVGVLVSLGTPGGKISLWLLSGAVLVSAVSAGLGAWLGGVALNAITKLALAAATALYAVDDRYSESTVGVVRPPVEMGEIPAWPGFAAFGFVFVLCLLLCWVFLKMAQRQSVPKKGKVFVKTPKGGTSFVGRGALRFALLSARRGGWRSGVVPAVALVLSLLLGILAITAGGWSNQMDALYRDTRLTGRITDTNGRQCTGIVLPPEQARTLWESGMLEDLSVSISFPYWRAEDMPAFGSGSFAQESRSAWIKEQPHIQALNSLDAAPEFIYTGPPAVQWLTGWEESFLKDPEACASLPETQGFYGPGVYLPAEKEATPIPCLMPEALLRRLELELGDTVALSLQFLVGNDKYETQCEFMPVGSFVQTGEEANIYVPLALWCDESWLTGQTDVLPAGQRAGMPFHSYEERDQYIYYNARFSTCVFTLTEAAKLDAFRDYLTEVGLSSPDVLRRNRTTAVLYDRAFVETVSGLGRYISFSRQLFPVLFLLVAVLGFIISWLMVNARRMEFAILRGLGASRTRVFFSFFLEQMLLCLAGCLGGSIVLAFVAEGLLWLGAIGVFALCYLLGTAASVLTVGRIPLMYLLSERE